MRRNLIELATLSWPPNDALNFIQQLFVMRSVSFMF
jgi:hypothetical protein